MKGEDISVQATMSDSSGEKDWLGVLAFVQWEVAVAETGLVVETKKTAGSYV